MNSELRAKVRRLNSEIAAMTTGCYHDRPCPGPIARAVEDCGFDVAALDRRYEPESQGQASFEIGRGVWLCISWYKLPITGRFEIVAYAS